LQELIDMPMGDLPRDPEHLRAVLQARSAARGGTAVDLYRTDGYLVLNADLPGIDPGSLQVEIDGPAVVIRAYRTLRGMDGDTRWDVRDREAGQILRRVMVGESVDAAGIAPHYAAGVLSLYLPVTEGRRRSVPVVFPRQELPGEAA